MSQHKMVIVRHGEPVEVDALQVVVFPYRGERSKVLFKRTDAAITVKGAEDLLDAKIENKEDKGRKS